MKTLVLGLGNELLCDDGIGILAAERLKEILGAQVDVESTSVSGLALLDYLVGYDRAILIDAVQSGQHPVGTVFEIEHDNLREIISPSPHYAGLPELIQLAEELSLDFPKQFHVLAVEVEDCLSLGKDPCEAVLSSLEEIVSQVKKRLSC